MAVFLFASVYEKRRLPAMTVLVQHRAQKTHERLLRPTLAQEDNLKVQRKCHWEIDLISIQANKTNKKCIISRRTFPQRSNELLPAVS